MDQTPNWPSDIMHITHTTHRLKRKITQKPAVYFFVIRFLTFLLSIDSDRRIVATNKGNNEKRKRNEKKKIVLPRSSYSKYEYRWEKRYNVD